MVDLRANGDEEKSHLDFDIEIVFLTLVGDALKANAKRITLIESEEKSHCTLSLEVEWSVYQQLLAGEWMGLFAQRSNRDLEVKFDEKQPVELQVMLKQSLMKAALRKGSEVENVLQSLVEDSEESRPLRQSESWLITDVKQQMSLPEELDGGTLRVGYRTQWAEPAVTKAASTIMKSTLNEVVNDYLKRMELPFEWVDETIARLSFSGENGEWIVLVRTDEEKQICIVFSIYPALVPEEQRTEVAKFLFEENYDLVIGNFEMDATDGELRYRTSIDVENDRLTLELFNQLFTTNVVIMDHYYHVIDDIIQNP
ncbi:YbjN domain-containing protein [Paenibacillus anseongense]|uniref:YbjN domain-containing protein n=1 Tax=Paenibacillus TaxID=44249 RepID=UPI002DB754CC|nr:YbjN domain-containing protein [Paenibacillus anseongense]MEC0265504.1 YbjN domain-containing protein [Paenibacillus anseongense]